MERILVFPLRRQDVALWIEGARLGDRVESVAGIRLGGNAAQLDRLLVRCRVPARSGRSGLAGGDDLLPDFANPRRQLRIAGLDQAEVGERRRHGYFSWNVGCLKLRF